MIELTSDQIRTITQSSYLHIAHYHELGNDDVSHWVNKMKQAKQQARAGIQQLISDQQDKENEILDGIFRGSCSVQELVEIGFDEAKAAHFCSAFNKGKNGSSIGERLKGLNDLISSDLPSSKKEKTTSAMTKVADVVGECFGGGNGTGISVFSTLEEERLFISGLNSIARSLDEESRRKEYVGVMQEAMQAAVRKLNSATSYYISNYKSRVVRRGKIESSLDSLFSNIEEFIQVKGEKDWKKEYQVITSFDEVKTVIQRSAQGYLTQAGGLSYEKVAAQMLVQQIASVFEGTTVEISNKRTYVKGGKTDKISGTQQKADISLTFTLEATEKAKDYFRISFSVKKKDSGATIQVHNGGSLFAYSSRFNNIGFGGADFSFLNTGNFQYVYVNELMENGAQDFKEGFLDMLRGLGFMFLGEQIGKQAGADFLFINGKIYAFSEVLQRIADDESLINVRIRVSSKKQPISEKRKLMDRMPIPPAYSNEFIKESIKIGKSAIYGTSYQINLMKSAYKI